MINARSLLSKLNAVKALAISSNPDVILITETWLTESVRSEQISIPGYQTFRCDRSSRRGGGCLAYTKVSLFAELFHHPTLDRINDSIWLSIPALNQELIIGCIYIPPNRILRDLQLLIDSFNLLADLPASFKLIAGDFNLPQIDWASLTAPPSLQQLLSCIHLGNWVQNVQSPTRGSNILDLIFTLLIPDASTNVLNLFPGSDHKIISCKFSIPRSTQAPSSSPRSFHLVPWELLPNFIRSLHWDDFFLSLDPQTVTNSFYDNIMHCLLTLCPSISNPQHNVASPLSLAQRKLLKLQRSFFKSRDITILLRFEQLSHKIQSLTDAKLRRDELLALRHADKVGRLSRLLKIRNPRPSYISQIKYNGTLLNSPLEISEVFSDIFSSSLVSDPLFSPPIDLPPTLVTLGNIDFHLKDIQRLTSSLKLSFRSGPDGLPPAFFRLGGSDIPLLLLNLFNISLKHSIFPSQWKTSVIVPLHKRGPRNDPQNYRPINHTPIISRIMERIVKDQLSIFLLSNNLLNQNQHGFLKNRSCTTCQFDFLNQVTYAADNGKALIVIFLDMTKAFDRVPHARLLTKLQTFGISNPLLAWFSSYLSTRFQVVSIGDHLSKPKPVTSGVVQGSVLGPLLFLLYINDIFPAIRYGVPFLFADDIKIIYEFHPNSLHSTLSNISQDLDSLNSWCQTWRMEFSASKSSLLTYRCQVPSGSLLLNGTPISNSVSVRDLGLHYSCTFNFSEQASYQIAKAKRTIAFIHKSLLFLDSKLIVYKSHVRPLLEYCPIVYSSMCKSTRVSIESVQRSFTKQLLGYSNILTYKQRCETLKLDPLWIRRIKLNLGFLHSLVYHPSFSPLQLNFAPQSAYPLRHRVCSLPVPRCRLAIRSNFFLNVYIGLWNKLPLTVRSCSPPNSFKHALNNFLNVTTIIELSNSFVSCDCAYESGLDF